MSEQRTILIFVENYTELPVGVKILKGDIAECPNCKKAGVVEHRGNKTFYFHRLGYKFIANESLPEIIDETCPTAGDVKGQ